MKRLWNRMSKTDKLAIGIFIFYLSMYAVADVSEAIAIWLFR